MENKLLISRNNIIHIDKSSTGYSYFSFCNSRVRTKVITINELKEYMKDNSYKFCDTCLTNYYLYYSKQQADAENRLKWFNTIIIYSFGE